MLWKSVYSGLTVESFSNLILHMSDSRPLYGLPLLSGLPPTPTDSSRAELSCRKCNKEFNIIFTRQKRCNHCGTPFVGIAAQLAHMALAGYSYCSSCVDYQALMPRGGSESGYITMSVCAFCIEFLNSTRTHHIAILATHRFVSYGCGERSTQDHATQQAEEIRRCVQHQGRSRCREG